MMAGHSTLWVDDPHLSYLIAGNLVNAVGDPDLQRIRRHIMDILDQLDCHNDQMEIIRAGGCAEGFRMRGTDVDQMHVDKRTKVVAEVPRNLGTDMAVVRLLKTSDVPPGYVKLAVQTPHTPVAHIRESTHRVGGGYYLSSEEFVRWFHKLNPNGVLHGPCVMERHEQGPDHDRAFCLEFKEWPVYANEWVERKRSYGWPSRGLIEKIKSQGCHLMAIGSKKLTENFISNDLENNKWIQDPFQWRLSFSLAEKQLIYSFNNTQFLTYGIFKLLNQEVFSQDSIVSDCICSYFLKSALFWTIEETPSDYWKPERLVFCVDICFQRLLEWTRNGICPNFFIRENNMFMGKVEEWQLEYTSWKLFELYSEGWRCLLRCHSLIHLKKALEDARNKIRPNSFPTSNPEEDFKCLRSSVRDRTQVEGNVDAVLFSEILSRRPKSPSLDLLELELRNSLKLEVQRRVDTFDLEILRLRRFQTLRQLALIYLNMSLTKHTTRKKYTYIRKAFCYLHLSRFSDICKGNLTLATAYYCLGRFDSALKYIKKYDDILKEDLGYIHTHLRHGVVYQTPMYCSNFCGRGLSSLDKMSLAVSYDFEVHRPLPLIPNEIALEIVMMRKTESSLFILPGLYSVFLKILCYTNKSNLKMVEELSMKLKEFLHCSKKEDIYMNYIMLAVAFVKLGNYDKALQYYCLAHVHKRRFVMCNRGCPEWQTRTSVLFYIAQMLQSLMPI
uniref:Mab-21-like HhH/H2TH-like domain-containing protein n=1 Tax=Magallana gigas TaxID=29159 RepID=A0A8W8HVP7_MAGGI|nr:uncharacterized protein LOC109619595 [Crassostrea gigas]